MYATWHGVTNSRTTTSWIGQRPACFGEGLSIRTSLSLLAVLLLVLANGFFVATEFALVSVHRTRMQQLAAEGNRRARHVPGELNHLATSIAATQLGSTMASLGLGWIGEPAAARLMAPIIASPTFIPAGTRGASTQTVTLAFGFSFIMALHIALGELAPKSLALRLLERIALRAAAPLHLFYLALRPATAGLNAIGNAIIRLVGLQPASGHQLVQMRVAKLRVIPADSAALALESALGSAA
jgi:CBS domain containing-hemolysin-like protein